MDAHCQDESDPRIGAHPSAARTKRVHALALAWAVALASGCSFERIDIRLAVDASPGGADSGEAADSTMIDTTAGRDVIDSAMDGGAARDVGGEGVVDVVTSTDVPRCPGTTPTRCGGRCVSLTTTASDCGACGRVCPGATNAVPTCSAGACGIACVAGTGDCDGDASNGCETNFATRTAHCGRCGNACNGTNGTARCTVGVCGIACAAGFGNCDGDANNGCEVATTTSVTHCGTCSTACSATQRCTAGRCAEACPAGMRLIPAGEIVMGGEDLAPRFGSAEYYRNHRVRLSAFCMDETEVTVEAYGQCLSPRACTTPGTTTTDSVYCNWTTTGPVAGREQHPINCIDWNAASAYCRFRGGALPTEAQWEYAARSSDNRLYPWGNAAPTSQLCWSGGGTSRTSTCSVREHPATGNAHMLFGMSGNVWEWTADCYGVYPSDFGVPILDPFGPMGSACMSSTSRVYRGGSWNHVVDLHVRAAIRGFLSPADRLNVVGFRCSRLAM